VRRLLLILPLALAGCAETDQLLNRADKLTQGREANLAAAARVDQVGRQILAANPFTGDVRFETVGAAEMAIFHRDRHAVIITDSLVEKCRTDGELAAVLCTELAVVVAEQRNSARMGVADPIPDMLPVPSAMEAGGITADQVRLAELAIHEQRRGKAVKEKPTDPKALAAEYLKSAGYEAVELKNVEPILAKAETDSPLIRQVSGAGILPNWSR
jgi:hypothetical protein